MSLTPARITALLALAVAIAAALYLAFAATSTSVRCVGGDCVTTHSSVIDDDGAAVLLLLLAPALFPLTVLLAVVRGWPRVLEWILAALFLASCTVAFFSVGLFYFPAALLTWCAAFLDRRDASQTAA